MRFVVFRKMYVGALAMNTTERSLTDYFTQFGEVSNCQVGTTVVSLTYRCTARYRYRIWYPAGRLIQLYIEL